MYKASAAALDQLNRENILTEVWSRHGRQCKRERVMPANEDQNSRLELKSEVNDCDSTRAFLTTYH